MGITGIDMRSMVISFVIVDIVITAVMILLWIQNRKRYRETKLWLIDFVFQTVGVILIAMRGSIPDWLSLIVSNVLVMTGTLLGLIALERFIGISRKHLFNTLLILVFASVHYIFSIEKNDLHLRNLNFGVTMLILSFQYFLLVFFRTDEIRKKIVTGVGLVFAGYSTINLLRIINFFVSDSFSNDYFHPDVFEKAVFVNYQILFIFLTYILALMYNKKLLGDLSTQEEKFSKAFHSAPYAIVISALKDGKIIEVNRGFETISGFQRTEALGFESGKLGFWPDAGERKSFVDELRASGKVTDREMDFRIKSGKTIRATMSSEIIMVNNEECLISSINDVTDKKKAEKELSEKVSALESMNRDMTGRELRMIELKKEINELCIKLGLPERY